MPFLFTTLGCIFMGAVLFNGNFETVGQRTCLNFSAQRVNIPLVPFSKKKMHMMSPSIGVVLLDCLSLSSSSSQGLARMPAGVRAVGQRQLHVGQQVRRYK